MGRVVEGLWNCPYCGQKGIGGLKTICPVCDTTRGQNVKFYLGEEKKVLDKETVEKVGTKPDWLCSYCDCLNNDKFLECKECGASREASTLNYFENQKKQMEIKKSLETPSFEEYDNSKPSQKPLSQPTSQNTHNNDTPRTPQTYIHKKKSSPKKFFKITAIIMSAILLLTGLIFLLVPKNVEGTVVDFDWERQITVEEFKTVEESDWSLPAGARLKYQKQEINGYRQVISHYETKTRTYTEEVFDHYDTVVVGYEDNGNGTFSEITNEVPVYRTETRTETYEEPVYKEEPIYQTKYYYEIDKWVYKDTVKAQGNDKNPEWPTYKYKNQEREGSRTEEYTVTLEYDGKTKDFKLSFDEWKSLKKGDVVKLKTHINGDAEIIYE